MCILCTNPSSNHATTWEKIMYKTSVSSLLLMFKIFVRRLTKKRKVTQSVLPGMVSQSDSTFYGSFWKRRTSVDIWNLYFQYVKFSSLHTTLCFHPTPTPPSLLKESSTGLSYLFTLGVKTDFERMYHQFGWRRSRRSERVVPFYLPVHRIPSPSHLQSSVPLQLCDMSDDSTLCPTRVVFHIVQKKRIPVLETDSHRLIVSVNFFCLLCGGCLWRLLLSPLSESRSPFPVLLLSPLIGKGQLTRRTDTRFLRTNRETFMKLLIVERPKFRSLYRLSYGPMSKSLWECWTYLSRHQDKW